jgi:hypothetical protein
MCALKFAVVPANDESAPYPAVQRGLADGSVCRRLETDVNVAA